MRPMRQIGEMIKKFLTPKTTNYWICVPQEMDNYRQKEMFIMDTISFLQDKIIIKNK
jgi:predicted RNase H-related nuclease YkuK (DUF458 family)